MSMLARCFRVSDQEIDRFAAGTADVRPLLNATDADDERPSVDLDAAWRGLHWLLTGSEWDDEPPLGFLLGGRPLPGKFGLGPPRAFGSAEVREIAAALDGIAPETLPERFDPETMDLGPDEDDGFAYHIDRYRALREFVLAAARDGSGMVVTIF